MRSSPQALGALAVLVFAMTIPMTRLANGTLDDPQLPPLFVAVGRAALAGVLAALYLVAVKAPWPQRRQWPLLGAVVAGAILMFPVCMGLAVRVVPAAHAAVVTGALPLATAALAAWWLSQRPGPWFWWAAGAGCALVAAFALWAAQHQGGRAAMLLATADGLLVLAVLGGAGAYVAGAVLSRQMVASHVISWALVLAMPVTVAGAWMTCPTAEAAVAVHWSAWAGLAYVAIGSSWLGYFAWYAALAREPMRVSQLQLMQPFLSIGLSCVFLGEAVDAVTVAFALAVLCLVLMAQRRPRPSAGHPA